MVTMLGSVMMVTLLILMTPIATRRVTLEPLHRKEMVIFHNRRMVWCLLIFADKFRFYFCPAFH